MHDLQALLNRLMFSELKSIKVQLYKCWPKTTQLSEIYMLPLHALKTIGHPTLLAKKHPMTQWRWCFAQKSHRNALRPDCFWCSQGKKWLRSMPRLLRFLLRCNWQHRCSAHLGPKKSDHFVYWVTNLLGLDSKSGHIGSIMNVSSRSTEMRQALITWGWNTVEVRDRWMWRFRLLLLKFGHTQTDPLENKHGDRLWTHCFWGISTCW